MALNLHRGDLPSLHRYGAVVAIDTETMGLVHQRDRLCVVQLSPGDGTADVVQIPPGAGPGSAPHIEKLLGDDTVLKLFHFARFDVAVLARTFGIVPKPVYCTKIASKLVRTYTDKHGLKDVVKALTGAEISKQEQMSDWGAPHLTPQQVEYAASDVLHLHAVKDKLDALLAREGRTAMAQACFDFLPTRALLDVHGFGEVDIFAHT